MKILTTPQALTSLDNMNQLPPSTSTVMKIIKVIVKTRQPIGSNDTDKKNIYFIIKYTDGTYWGPIFIKDKVTANQPADIDENVPDLTPSLVYFFWEEQCGTKSNRKSAIFERDSKSIGHPWSAIYLAFDGNNLSGNQYEYCLGGIGIHTV